MLIIIYFTGILILASLNYINMFVITRFDLPTMTEYYRSVTRMSRHSVHRNQFFQHQNMVQFCQQLRSSIYFDRTNNTHVSVTGDFKYVSWPNDQEMEHITAVMDNLTISLHNGISVTLPTFFCMNDDEDYYVGDLETVIAPGMFPNTAILSVGSIVHLDDGLTVKLIAVIDAPAILHQDPPNFNDFIEARRGLQRDPLCDLKKLLKYRLCAAAVEIGFGPLDHRYVYNKYYQPQNEEESCRSLEGTDRESRPYPRMLYCTVKLATSKEFESFYLSLDVLKTNNVLFVQQFRNGSQYELKTKYLFVPLLEHFELYEEALIDLDI